MSDKSVTVELTATSAVFTEETNKAANSTRGLSEEAKQAGISLSSSFEKEEASSSRALKKMGTDADSYRHKLEELKQIGGRRSALGETLETLKGAGALAGISILGEELKKATEKAAELDKEFREGKIDAMGLGVGIASSLPIIGGFVAAGQNIREMLYHEKEQIDDINESIKSGNKLMEDRVEIQKGNKKEDEDLGDRMTRAKDQLAIAKARTDNEKDAAEAIAKADEQRISDAKDLESVIEGITSRYGKLDKDARDDQEKKRKEVESAPVTSSDRRNFWRDHADEARTAKDADEVADMIKRHKIAAIDAAADAAIKADKKEMDSRITTAKSTFDQLQALHKQTQDADVAHKQDEKKDKALKEGEKKLMDIGESLYKFGVKAAEAIDKGMEKSIKEAAEKAKERAKEVADLTAERDAIAAGKDPSAAKMALENPEAAKIKEQIDELNKRNELLKEAETPQDKFKQKLDEINKLQKDGLLTMAQAAKLKADNAKELQKSDSKELKDDGVAKITGERRFSFDVQSKGSEVALQVAKDHKAEAVKQSNWIMQIWQKLLQPGNPFVSLDSLGK